LHITAQYFILPQFGWLWTAQRTIGMPLRGGGPIFQSAAAGCSIAAQFARDRRRSPPELAGNGANAMFPNPQDGNLFALGKR
jgi:hypothetical protein